MAIFTAIGAAATALVAAVGPAVAAVTGWVGGLGTLGKLALGTALSFAANALFGPRVPSFNNRQPQYQAVINQSTAARRRGYGRARLGGVRAFFDSKDGTLYQIIMLHQGQIDAYEEYYIGDRRVTIPSGGGPVDQNPWKEGNYAYITPFLGTSDQAAFSVVVSDWPQWTSDHRLRGIAYLVVRFRSPPSEDYLRIFPSGYNTSVTAVGRLCRVLDTRPGAIAWSDNPALCLADYLAHPDGYGRLTYDDLDADSFNAFADICDEAIPLAGGGTEKRYRMGGVYELTDRPADVIQRMLAVCDGELFTTREGKLGIRGGKWTPPTVTIHADDILAHDMEEGADALDHFNRLKVVYTSPDHDYQPTEAEPWEDLADQAERGVRNEEMTLDYCQSASQARRLAKIRMAKANPRWTGTIRTNLAGLKARGERTIRLVLPELNIDTSFLVGTHNLILEQGVPVACEMQVISMSADAYDWDPVTEEGSSPPIPQDTTPDTTLETPQNIELTPETRSGVKVVVGVCNAPSRDDAQLEAQIAVASLLVWETMSVASGSLEAVSGALNAEDYVVRMRFRFGGAVGPWTANQPITVT